MTVGKTKLKRLKLSDPMVGISIRQAPPDLNVKEALCRIFAKQGINLTFISSQHADGKDEIFCCLIAEEGNKAKQLLDKTIPYFYPLYRIIPSVTLLSVFPHQSDIYLVCLLLQIFWKAQIPVYAVASSIAALTLVVDTDRINHTVATLEKNLVIQSEGYPY